MSISISTSEYTKQISVEIDGVEFKITPLSSSQTIAYLNLCEELDSPQNDEADKVKEIIEKMENIIYSIFDNPDKAREVLAKVPIQGVIEIYKKITTGE